MSGSQKFIARNRAPRVQIEYDVELYGAEKKVQLPFVMGVLSDLAGKSEQPPVADRKFLEIDVDNFDERMKSMAPRAAFTVPNTLTGEGNMAVDLTFESLEDFSPAAIASKMPALAPLLEARRHLDNLMAYMDGKSGAEALIESLLAEPALLKALGGGESDATDMEAALESLKARMPEPEPEDDSTDRTLAELAAKPRPENRPEPSFDDVLGGIEQREEPAKEDRTQDILAGIDRREDTAEADRTADVLSGIERLEEAVEEDRTDDVLAGLERRDAPRAEDRSDAVLAGLARAEEADETDEAGDVLAGIERRGDAAQEDTVSDVLAGIERREETAEEDRTDDILFGMDRREEAPDDDRTDDVLAGIDRREQADEADGVDGILAGLDHAPAAADGDETTDVLAGIERQETAPVRDDLDNILAGLDPVEPDHEEIDTLDDILAALDGPEAREEETSSDGTFESVEADVPAPTDADDPADDRLAGLEPEEPAEDRADTDLDDLLSDLDSVPEPDQAESDLDDLLADLGRDDDVTGDPEGDAPDPLDDLDALLADLGGSEDPTLADVETDDAARPAAGRDASPPASNADPLSEDEAAADDDLDALLAELETRNVGEDEANAETRSAYLDEVTSDGNDPDGDFDDLLKDLGAAELGGDAELDDLDALLGELTTRTGDESTDDDLDALLADMGTAELGADLAEADFAEALVPEARVGTAVPVQSPYGTITAPQPEREAMSRNRFRMAIFGDFTGRASRGLMETGDALAARRPILLDVDTLEEVVRGFATTLTLPIGKDGEGIEVKFADLDDLHPDELYEKVEIFEAISGLRQQLSVGSIARRATEQLKGWAEEFGTPVKLPKRSAATSVPPDLKLSDFQALIGDTRGRLTQPTPAEDLIARIVGPHVVKAPDAGASDMLKAVDDALGSAMRLVLHHPEFQAVESTWRSLDMLARRIETDSSLEIVLYDVSAEELAADLSSEEDLAQSGLYHLLTDVMDPEEGDGGFSALFGLYTFEETPPHAELLARIGLVAAHVDAPFFAAITPAYLETPKEERHTLVAKAWDGLRALPQAAYLGLASPRFMLRQPYGAKSDPCYEFEFEEFTPQEGLKGLLWANPVVLVAILLAATWKKDGKAMELGSLMSLGDIPFTYVTDRYGDQVALPCTERNLSSDAAQTTLVRGYMPVLSMKGRNEIRLGSFRSLGGDEIAGPWTDAAPPRPVPPQPNLEMEIAAGAEAGGSQESGKDDGDDPLAELDALLDTGTETDAEDALDALGSDDDDDGQSLDDLLASFADDDDAAGDDDDMDPELAALLEGL